jgi:chromosome segregation ATPase
MAKRVGAFLEMKIKGVKYAILSAFKRAAREGAADRAEADRLAKMAAEMNSQSLQRLKIFLMGKEMRLKYAAFSWWNACRAGGVQNRMEEALGDARKKRAALEAKLAALNRELGMGSGADMERAIADAQGRLSDADRKAGVMRDEIALAKKRLKDAEAQLQDQQMGRRDDKNTRRKLEQELADAKADKEGLEHELALIVDQIGFLSEYSR